jgi:hypothetical protein
MLTTHLLEAWLKMSGAVPLVPFTCLHSVDWDNFTFYQKHRTIFNKSLEIIFAESEENTKPI